MNKEYKIEHVRDFLNVPPERIDDCIDEFKSFIALSRDLLEIFNPTGVKYVKGMVQRYTWIDNGKKQLRKIRITKKGNQ